MRHPLSFIVLTLVVASMVLYMTMPRESGEPTLAGPHEDRAGADGIERQDATSVTKADPASSPPDSSFVPSQGRSPVSARPSGKPVQERSTTPRHGRVEVLDKHGRLAEPINGTLVVKGLDQRLTIRGGRFEIPSELDGVLRVTAIESSENLPITLTQKPTSLELTGIPTDAEVVVHARLLPPILLTARSTVTGQQLPSVMVSVEQDGAIINDLLLPSQDVLTAALELDTPADLSGLLASQEAAEALWVSAPGHAWILSQVAPLEGGQHEVRLEPSAALEIFVPEHVTSDLDPAQSTSFLVLSVAHTDRGLESASTSRPVEPREAVDWHLQQLPTGHYEVTLLNLYDGTTFASASIELAAGERERIVLEGFEPTEEVDLATLEILQPTGTQRLPFSLLGGSVMLEWAELESMLQWQLMDDGSELGTLTGLEPGHYLLIAGDHFEDEDFGMAEVLLPSGATRRIEWFTPSLVDVTIELYSTDGKPLVTRGALQWMLSPSAIPMIVMRSGTCELTDTQGVFRGQLPLGQVFLDAPMYGGPVRYGLLDNSIRVDAAGQTFRLEVVPCAQFVLLFDTGSTMVSRPEFFEVAEAMTLEGPGSLLALDGALDGMEVTVSGPGTWEVVIGETPDFEAARSGTFELTVEGRPRIELKLVPKRD